MNLDDVKPVREVFEKNVKIVEKYLKGSGLDMGCGSCPLLLPNCKHIDISPQPLAEIQVGVENVIQHDAFTYHQKKKVDYIFSSHMLEDLGSKDEIIICLLTWSHMVKQGGYIVLILPDMQGGRYPTVEEGANPSHRVNVGTQFFEEIDWELFQMGQLKMVQMDRIPHDQDCSFDVVFRVDK